VFATIKGPCFETI